MLVLSVVTLLVLLGLQMNHKNGTISVTSSLGIPSSNLNKVEESSVYVARNGEKFQTYNGNFFSVDYPSILMPSANIEATSVVFENENYPLRQGYGNVNTVQVYPHADINDLSRKAGTDTQETEINNQKFIRYMLPKGETVYLTQGNGFALRITFSQPEGVSNYQGPFITLSTLKLK